MKVCNLITLNSAVMIAGFALGSLAYAASSDVDTVFVGKVSQGGSYEVEASKFAKLHAVAQDVKDLAVAEVHDHELVNRALKKLADAAGITVAPTLDAEYKFMTRMKNCLRKKRKRVAAASRPSLSKRI